MKNCPFLQQELVTTLYLWREYQIHSNIHIKMDFLYLTVESKQKRAIMN